MSEFFEPRSASAPEEKLRCQPPPRTVRPQGTPLGVVLTELLLARSQTAAIYITYLDAYPTGFEFEVKAITSTAGDEFGRDVFGRHWPMAGQKRDELPPQLLRVGVRFADERTATNISGHARSPAGPVIWPLAGRAGGGRFQQGYWVSPLPPPGPFALVCEWPAAGISLARHELDAQLILDAADRVPGEKFIRAKDGREWRIGTDAEVAWINGGTSRDTAITAAIPPIFDSYCTLALPQSTDAELTRHEQAVMALLSEHTEQQAWWLGYLDTGASDTVFPDAPTATVYEGHRYVLIEAGPQQTTWRDSAWNWTLPELMFPVDRSWLVSTRWDDDWTCIGGSEELVSSFLRHPELGPRARRMSPGEPPGEAGLDQ